MNRKVYQAIANAVSARINCQRNGNEEWESRHFQTVSDIVRNYLPSGGGFDNGTAFDWDKSTPEKLVFNTSFHHMNEAGYYDGWTDHIITVTPSFIGGFDIKISGRDRNGIKEYIGDAFHQALNSEMAMPFIRPLTRRY